MPLPQATLIFLDGYYGHPQADVMVDHPEAVASALHAFLVGLADGSRLPPIAWPAQEGEVADLWYRIQGSGPPILLLPLGLAPSGWRPLLSRLSAHYTTITVGGAALGAVAGLEARGQTAGYLNAIEGLVKGADLQPDEVILDVGCGSGVIDRWLVRRTQGLNPIVAVDINVNFVREARRLAKRDNVGGHIAFQVGAAEGLPLQDQSVDMVLSTAVMEWLDAERMLQEMVRVTRPGGRVAALVRATDRPAVVNLPLEATLKQKVEALPSGMAVSQGCADASLYPRMRAAGLVEVQTLPQWVRYDDPERLRFMQAGILPHLSPSEALQWQAAVSRAEEAGTFFIEVPFHGAVGTRSY